MTHLGALYTDFVCSLHFLSLPLGWRKRSRWDGRKALREEVGPPGVPALAAPPPGPAGGFPRLNGTAGELDRGRGCQLPGLGRGLGKEKCKSGEKVWGGNTHNTPEVGKHEVGRRERGVSGNPGIPAIRGMGGVRKSPYTKREGGEKERERAKDEGCVSWGGGTT